MHRRQTQTLTVGTQPIGDETNHAILKFFKILKYMCILIFRNFYGWIFTLKYTFPPDLPVYIPNAKHVWSFSGFSVIKC